MTVSKKLIKLEKLLKKSEELSSKLLELNNDVDENKLSKKDVFYKVSWGNKPLFAYSQVGHIEKFIDVTVWVFVPIYLFNQGINIIDISILVGIYTITWGILQIFSGYYSDIFGRNKLIMQTSVRVVRALGAPGSLKSVPGLCRACGKPCRQL